MTRKPKSRCSGSGKLWAMPPVTDNLRAHLSADKDEGVWQALGGGFVLAPTNNVMPETPVENVVALYETVGAYQ